MTKWLNSILYLCQEHWDGKYPNMKIAMASSADTPFAEKVGRASLKLLEVVPGVTVWDICMRDWDGEDVNQIGRQPPLSSNKSMTHFPFLRERTGIRYDKMLFFDDCLGPHVIHFRYPCVYYDYFDAPRWSFYVTFDPDLACSSLFAIHIYCATWHCLNLLFNLLISNWLYHHY